MTGFVEEIKKIPLAVIVGPTASGKTALSVELAERIGGEIISGDSMQIYKEMDIATAKPSKEEMRDIPHHLIDFLSPCEEFNVSDYTVLAGEAILDVHKRNKLPILTGGTGLYINSLIDNIVFTEIKTDENLRKFLENEYKEHGGIMLLERLRKIDPEAALKLHPANAKRIIRALEVYELTGINISKHRELSRVKKSPYDLYIAGLHCEDRQKLYEKINKRTDKMVEDGLVEEAKKILGMNASKTALQAIGYKEIKPYLDGQTTIDDAIVKIKTETRRYAKRQLTWFRRDKRIEWYNNENEKNFCAILNKIEKAMENKIYL